MTLGKIFSSNLLQDVLIQPVNDGCDTLLIAAGYASPIMVLDHYEELRKLKLDKQLRQVDLIVGMTSTTKFQQADHDSFKRIVNDYSNGFSCRYLYKKPQFHSKLYFLR